MVKIIAEIGINHNGSIEDCKKMIMFQIGDEENQFIIDTRHVSIAPLKYVLEDKNIIKIFHNAKFDYKFIKRY